MALTAGIVGLPNVGKSTLFNAITKSAVEAANYPFATIDKNVGVVEVKDERVKILSNMFKPKKTIYTTFEFTDIAGLVKGASKGEGLGNQFLANIREVDAIVHVVRCFEDKNITHVHDRIDAIEDIEIIDLELQLADLQTIDNRISKVERKAKMGSDKEAKLEYDTLLKVKTGLEANKSVSDIDLDDSERAVLMGYHLLTDKPVIFVANIEESLVSDPTQNEQYNRVVELAKTRNAQVIAISAKMEQELSELEDEEREMFLEDLGLTESGLDKIVKSSYSILKLRTFFTVGPDEVRAWTFHDGMKAPQCAGVIHTDFQKGFIRAETYSYEDLIKYKSELGVKEAGRLRLEGKEYVVKDGDIMHFRFNV